MSIQIGRSLNGLKERTMEDPRNTYIICCRYGAGYGFSACEVYLRYRKVQSASIVVSVAQPMWGTWDASYASVAHLVFLAVLSMDLCSIVAPLDSINDFVPLAVPPLNRTGGGSWIQGRTFVTIAPLALLTYVWLRFNIFHSSCSATLYTYV